MQKGLPGPAHQTRLGCCLLCSSNCPCEIICQVNFWHAHTRTTVGPTPAHQLRQGKRTHLWGRPKAAFHEHEQHGERATFFAQTTTGTATRTYHAQQVQRAFLHTGTVPVYRGKGVTARGDSRPRRTGSLRARGTRPTRSVDSHLSTPPNLVEHAGRDNQRFGEKTGRA